MMNRLKNLCQFMAILPSLLYMEAYGNPPAAPALMPDYNYDPLEDNVESPQCNVGEKGFYGEVTVNETPIEFKYELEYTAQSSIGQVLAVLERAIADTVLPTLFVGECKMNRQFRRRLQPVGISIKPPDIEIGQVDCTLTLMKDSSCAVMDGSMTIYTNDGTFGNTVAVKGEIEKAMNNGNFNTIPGVVNVVYVDDDLGTAPIEGDETSGTQSTPTDNGLAPTFYAVIAAGGLVVIIVGVLWRRRKDQDTTSVLTDDSHQTGAATISAALSPLQEVTPTQNVGALDFTPIS